MPKSFESDAIESHESVGDEAWRSAAHYLAVRSVVDPIEAKLAAIGVRILAIKGAALIRSIYRDEPWNRPMSDIDWIVAPSDRSTIEQVLSLDGWSRVARSAGEFERRVGAVSVRIDLQTELGFLPVGALRSIGERATSAHPPIQLPTPEDHFVIIAAHAVVAHGQLRPVWRRDLERLVVAGVDLSTVIERARRWSLLPAVSVVLDRLSLRSIELDRARDSVRLRRRSERVLAGISNYFLDRPELPRVGHLMQWLYARGLRAKLTRLRRASFPSADFVRRRYVGPSLVARVARPFALGLHLLELVARALLARPMDDRLRPRRRTA